MSRTRQPNLHPIVPGAPPAGGAVLDSGVLAADVARSPARPAWLLPGLVWREQVVSFVLVLVLASALRLPLPDLTPFGHDEALEAERARPIWYGARPVESEITSWWIPDPAGLLYFFALAEPFPQPAVARVVLVSAANVLSVLVCYLFARRFFGPRIGLLAGLLYAVNPWAVTFGRQPWVITQPLLTTLMLLAAGMVVVRGDRRWIVPFFVAGAAQTQTHLLAVLYGPPALLTLVLFARRWLAWQLAVALTAAVALVAPYALHLWSIRDSIAEALARGNRGLTFQPDGTAATLLVWLVSGLQLDLKLGFPDPWLAALWLPLAGCALLTALLLGVGTAVTIRACLRRQPGWQADALVLIWFLAPLMLMTWQSSQVYIHYVLCLLPTPFILIARGAAFLAEAGPAGRRWFPKARARFVPAAVASVLAVQVAAVVAFYAALDRTVSAPPSDLTPTAWQQALNAADLKARQRGIGELHGLPLRYWQQVADRTKEAASAAGLQDVTVITDIADDANRHLDRRRKALSYLLGPELRPRFPLTGLIVLPTRQDTLMLAVPEQDLPRAARRDAVKLVEIPFPGTNGDTRVWRIRARPHDQIAEPRAEIDVPVAPGVRLLGVDGPPRAQPGQTVPLTVFLLVEAEQATRGALRPYVDLVVGASASRQTAEPLTSESRGGLPSADWRPGDLLLQRITLTVPVDAPLGDHTLRAGVVEPVTGETSARPAARLRVRLDRE